MGFFGVWDGFVGAGGGLGGLELIWNRFGGIFELDFDSEPFLSFGHF